MFVTAAATPACSRERLLALHYNDVTGKDLGYDVTSTKMAIMLRYFVTSIITISVSVWQSSSSLMSTFHYRFTSVSKRASRWKAQTEEK